ncbi:helix-turn-helix domain-containing protein [Roseibium alexandrii]|uniref:helix-turn-helix domain-containing protein n=2 Tax=Roseibium alexandrii TaxID=388408 RepID=UPI0037534D92
MMLTQATLRGLEQITDIVVSSQSHQVDVLQLSAGEAKCSATLLEFADIRLLKSKFSARHRWIDTGGDRSVHLVLPAATTKSGASVNGGLYEAKSVFCRSGPGTVFSVSEPDFECFEVVLSEKLADAAGLPTGIVSLFNLSSAVIDPLQNVLQRALHPENLAGSRNTRPTVTQAEVLQAVEDVFDEMPVPETVVNTATQNRELIISNAEAIMNDWDPEARLEIDNLCHELGRSRRTIHHAFRMRLGIGPVAFYRLKRLHALRGSLVAAEPETTRIADLAHSLGFFETGRMAGNYNEIFGELPSETLKRRKAL